MLYLYCLFIVILAMLFIHAKNQARGENGEGTCGGGPFAAADQE